MASSVAVPGGVHVQLADAFAEERRLVVFELHVPSLAALGAAKVADARAGSPNDSYGSRSCPLHGS